MHKQNGRPAKPVLLRFPDGEPPSPRYSHRKTFEVEGMILQVESLFWAAADCDDPKADAVPEIPGLVKTTRLWNVATREVYEPISPFAVPAISG
jgi:hypothetical protein